MKNELEQKEHIERIENEAVKYIPGEWYWVENEEDEDKSLGCVIAVGSNHVKVAFIGGYFDVKRADRYLFDKFDKIATHESHPEDYINRKQKEIQKQITDKMEEIKELSYRLGVKIDNKQITCATTDNAIIPVNQTDIKKYKNDLIHAQKEQLPRLFEEIRKLNDQMVMYMESALIPMKAEAEVLKNNTKSIEDKIHNVELYAGLMENIVHIKKGQKGEINDKIHLMQRRCYMDEECLMNYQTGGIELKDIKDFDEWLAEKENFERILPFQKCIVSFRVRRFYHIPQIRIAFNDKNDMKTFLYIRNGQNLYRINTSINFGEKLFPDNNEWLSDDKLWGKTNHKEIETLITDREYQIKLENYLEKKKKAEQWEKDNPDEHEFDNPYRRYDYFREEEWHPYTPEDVFYDDINIHIGQQQKHYNKIAVIIQGMLDRSEILHPHLPIQMWEPKSFHQNIVLIRDDDNVLYPTAEPPDFNAYRDRLNATLKNGSLTVGQQIYWEEEEAKKENERQNRDWRIKNPTNYTRFKPHNDPGPGEYAQIFKFHTRKKTATYKWVRQSRSWRSYGDGAIPCKITVPLDRIINVGAYQEGDYLQFFNDVRTREKYIEWAYLLLLAEDHVRFLKKLEKTVRK